jgi:hypothetical protein
LQAKNQPGSVPAMKKYNKKTMIIMKKIFLLAAIIFPLLVSECRADNPVKGDSVSPANGPVTQMTNETFKKLIFNYEA